MAKKTSLEAVQAATPNCEDECGLKVIARRMGLTEDQFYNLSFPIDFDEKKQENAHAVKELTRGCEKECKVRKYIALKWEKRVLYQTGCILIYEKKLKSMGVDLPLTDIERFWVNSYAARFANKYKEYEDGLNIRLFYDMVTRVELGDDLF